MSNQASIYNHSAGSTARTSATRSSNGYNKPTRSSTASQPVNKRAMDNLASKYGNPDPYTIEEDKNKRSKNIMMGVACVSVTGVLGFLIWKYGLDSPTNVQELKDGAGNLWEDIGDTWDEWDLGNMTDVLDGLDDLSFGGLFNEDPKLGNNQTTRWKSDYIKDDGLHLTLYNALDDTWQQEYADAIADWQQSDALQLTTQRVAVDYECTRVDGVMVVCNANFGATGWVGINENSISSRGVILSSVSKMNEYYLRNADYNHRRFTMCHEVGHGLGLPHTDENPYNKDLGNCLDYTETPKNNLLPGDVNMVKLRSMYLRRRLLRVEKDGTVVTRTELIRR